MDEDDEDEDDEDDDEFGASKKNDEAVDDPVVRKFICIKVQYVCMTQIGFGS